MSHVVCVLSTYLAMDQLEGVIVPLTFSTPLFLNDDLQQAKYIILF